MPKVSPAYRAARREEILHAARRCFIRKGFQETSMQDLLAEAKLSSGAVYNYFASKEEMIVAIAEANIGQVTAMLRRSAKGPQPKSLGEAVAEILELIRRMHVDDDFAGMTVQVWAEALRNAALAARFEALAEELRMRYGELAQDAVLPPGTSKGSLAETVAAIVSGFILQLALFGPQAAQGLPDTVRALWPAAPGRP